MEYIFKPRNDCDKSWKRPDGGDISGYAKRTFEKKYPKDAGGYTVVGAIGKGCIKDAGVWSYHGREEKFYELGYNKFLYGISGYVEVGEHLYLAVLESRLKTRLIQMLITAAIVLGIIAGLYHLFQRADEPMIDPGSSRYVSDIELPENIDPDRITLPGYDTISMAAGTDTAYVALWNPDTNPCYFQFEISLEDSGEVVYESGLIPPGEAVTEVKFNRTFSAGLYPVIIRISSYNLQDYEKEMNGGEVSAVIAAVQE